MKLIINNKNKQTGELKELAKIDTNSIVSIEPISCISAESDNDIQSGIKVKDSLANSHYYFNDSLNKICLSFEESD